MPVNDLAEKILEQVRLTGPLKAKDIASALKIDRSAVNQVLHGPLKGMVHQGKDYNWSLAGPEAKSGTTAKDISKNSYAGLFQYYSDCLSQDDSSGISTFADSKYDLDYVEIQSWPFDDAAPAAASATLDKIIGRQRRDFRKKALWLGFPVLVQQARNRSGWAGSFVQPLIIWPQDPDSQGLAFLAEPIINTRALSSLVSSENALDEAAYLADELGLDGGDPPIDELAARLRELRPEWSWKDTLEPTSLKGGGELRRIKETGIYNAAIVVLADRSPFTAGLERELADLRAVSDSDIAKSSLGTLLGNPGSIGSIEGPLLEATPLNAEQRSAVNEALTQPLTVITGPPGTGKSQVVTAILVNAAWRGLRVLFASKNNKAVDVVMERVNALAPRPVVLRLGARALQEQLAQHLTAVLSGKPTDADRISYGAALSELKAAGEVLAQNVAKTEELVRLRNQVDELERSAERGRDLLPKDAFQTADGAMVSAADEHIEQLRIALQRSTYETLSRIDKLLWALTRKSREAASSVTADALRGLLASFGIELDDSSGPAATLARAKVYAEALAVASKYQSSLKKLGSSPDLGALASAISDATAALAEQSLAVWNGWTTLLPDRLGEDDRVALGDYAAILRMISKAEGDGGTVERAIWRRYYELAARSTKALPCWAVTSLSARGRIPFTAGEFDLVVIDEASQCDIASAVPLLYRAKRAVVIGDPQQLRHISRLSVQRDQALMVKHDLLDSVGPGWGYRANGLYDLAASRAKSESIIVLRDHHRSDADIINFSNHFFYGGRLRVATDYRRLKRPDGPAIRWVDVKGKAIRPTAGGAINQIEAAAVVDELRRIALTQRFSGEIGGVTPFRAQANLIKELIAQDDGLSAVLASRNFISETAHSFQGDERDLILFSPVVSRDTPSNAIGFLKSQGNLFNVGITRARGALVVIGDSAACTASDVDYLSEFARYVAKLSERAVPVSRDMNPMSSGRDYPVVSRPELVSDWEKVFFAALVDAGIRPIPQYEIDQYILDFALIRPNGRRLNIEIDGERYHRDWDGELVRRDQLRNLRLIEMGWDVTRFWVYEVRDALPDCIARIERWIIEADAAHAVVIEARQSRQASQPHHQHVGEEQHK